MKVLLFILTLALLCWAVVVGVLSLTMSATLEHDNRTAQALIDRAPAR